MDITQPITSLPGVGPALATKLAKLDLFSIFDLLYHLPFRYEDRTQIHSLGSVQPGETVTVMGTLDSLKNQFSGSGRLIQKGVISDSSSHLDLIWFNQPFLTRTLKIGQKIALYGKVEFYGRNRALLSPDYELFTDQLTHMGRIVPIYPETAGLTSKWFRTTIKKLIPSLTTGLPDLLPDLISWHKAISNIHAPTSFDTITNAKNRLAGDEILLLQLAGLTRKQTWTKNRLTHRFTLSSQDTLIKSLPFQLTKSQIQASHDINSDLHKPTPMNRLLEGDVGSGKTIVAALAAYQATQNNLQTIFLAPTQILATQHHQTLTTLFQPLGIEIGLITGTKKILPSAYSQLPILVGTHSLLNEKLDLTKVGLVVIDEQHRFGVMQRSLASLKGESPHILTMTATPIPRTLALAIHGDLDISRLELPSSRQQIKTWVVPEFKRDSAYAWIKSQVSTLKSQAFVVCPFIEPSETNTTVKAVTVEFAKLQKIFSHLKLGLLHGKLKPKDKDEIMANFKSGIIDILVATPVVEVGIDIPNATIILIEAADRFGLAQLHQLRGRVGRSSQQSYCLLFSDQAESFRLKSLETHSSGQELAEIDFRLRGPGHLYGTAQHGQIQFKIASYDNLTLISTVKALAEKIFPTLSNYPVLRKLVENDKISLIQPN